MEQLSTTLTNKPNTQMKECRLYMYMKPFRPAEWWTFISQWLKFHFQMFLPPNLKVSIYSLSAYLCIPLCKVWWSKANNWRKATSSILTCFWALSKVQKQDPQEKLGNCDFISIKSFITVSWSSESTDCAAENSKPQVMLQNQVPTNVAVTWGTIKQKLRKSQFLKRFGSDSCVL